MTRVIIETSDQSVAERIGVMVHNEAYLLRKTTQNVKAKSEHSKKSMAYRKPWATYTARWMIWS